MNKSIHIIIISTAITRSLALCSEGSSELSPRCSSYSSNLNPQAQCARRCSLLCSVYPSLGYRPIPHIPRNLPFRTCTSMDIEGRYTLYRYRPSLFMTDVHVMSASSHGMRIMQSSLRTRVRERSVRDRFLTTIDTAIWGMTLFQTFTGLVDHANVHIFTMPAFPPSLIVSKRYH
jgi:hypothetical protein